MATKVAIEVDVKTGEANDDIIALREELEKVKQTQKEMGDQFKAGFEAAEKGAKNASKGMKGFGQSIGSVIKSLGIMALALQVLAKIGELLQSNQRIADGLSKAMVTLEVVFGNVASAVQDLVDGLQDIKNLSFDDIIQKFRNFGNALLNGADGALKTAENIVRMRNELQLAEAEQRRFMLQKQREAEIQRQIRDNIELDIETRIKANDEIARILTEQTDGELKISDLRIRLRRAELATNEESIPLQAALVEALAEEEDVLERIAGITSEQKTNAAALRAEEQELFEQRNQASIEAEKFTVRGLYPWYSQVYEQILALDEEFKTNKKALEDFLRQTNADITDDEIAHNERMVRLTKSYEKQRSDIVKKEEAYKKKLREDGLTAAGAVLGSLGQLIAASGNQSKEAVALQKTLAVAQIAIDTAKAITGAIAQAQSVPYPGNLVAIATGVAAVVAGIASAVQTLNTANVPGGTAQPPSAPQVTTAPAVQQATAGTTELGGVEQAQLAPIQAYVVETEVTGNQNNVNQIESQATFGG